MSQAPFILASTSPQRFRLLEQMGLRFTVRPAECAEDLDQEPDADRLVELITRQKMAAAHQQFPRELVTGAWILSSDTLVALDHHRLGKPADRTEAGAFLDLLAGRSHQVLTGVCLSVPDGRGGASVHYTCSTSEVRFRDLTPTDREWYLDAGDWEGAAGGYRIQGLASCFIAEITGSYSGIVGLPIHDLYAILRELGYDFIL